MRFNNTLILQWGSVSSDGTYYFPITFTKIVRFSLASVHGNNGVPRIGSFALNNFYYSSANFAHCGAHYIVIGI